MPHAPCQEWGWGGEAGRERMNRADEKRNAEGHVVHCVFSLVSAGETGVLRVAITQQKQLQGKHLLCSPVVNMPQLSSGGATSRCKK